MRNNDEINRISDEELMRLVRRQCLTDCQQIRNERDDYRILVDITNSVLSQLDMEALVEETSRQMHHFFGLPAIGMVLPDPLRHGVCNVHLHFFPPRQAAFRQQFDLDAPGGAAAPVLERRSPVQFSRTADDARWARDPLLAALAAQGLGALLLLPLHQSPGALLLAHATPAAFDDHNRQLLAQIAARIGIAVDNAHAWREVTHLRDNLKQENIWLNEQIHHGSTFSDIVYQSEAMKAVLRQIEMVAASDSTVLLLGETGTGKEVVARAIHRLSGRQAKPMVKMNCAAVPASLLESDLFGHEKGAFTGAASAHTGRFEMAAGGSLFLDEIGDMPLELQPKLLRVLQEREIERLGGNRVIPVDVRVIAATNRDLPQMVQDREFRSDLYYRLNVFPISIPPLRERPEDIPLLAKHFTQQIARRMNRTIDTIPANALQHLCRYPWPGNVRELQNVIERAVILTSGRQLNLQLHELRLPSSPAKAAPTPVPTFPGMASMLRPQPPENDQAERERILQALRETNGIVAGPRGAAAKLGLKRTTLLSRMQRLGISARDTL